MQTVTHLQYVNALQGYEIDKLKMDISAFKVAMGKIHDAVDTSESKHGALYKLDRINKSLEMQIAENGLLRNAAQDRYTSSIDRVDCTVTPTDEDNF